MLCFPNSKINLGLYVTEKRDDGYHNIETTFYPVGWCDALEILENRDSKKFSISFSGIPVTFSVEDNLVYKAWRMLADVRDLPSIKVHLHKNIPMGSGLAGGSSDAAWFIRLMNTKFDLGLTEIEKTEMAYKLGSDCAFFMRNEPVFAEGRGDLLSRVSIDLSSYYILIVYPGIFSSTADAYAGVVPKKPIRGLRSIIEEYKVPEWRDLLLNDFEEPVFAKFHLTELLKENLYQAGALYASLSGSGSSVYGIFDEEPRFLVKPEYLYYLQRPGQKIL